MFQLTTQDMCGSQPEAVPSRGSTSQKSLFIGGDDVLSRLQAGGFSVRHAETGCHLRKGGKTGEQSRTCGIFLIGPTIMQLF